MSELKTNLPVHNLAGKGVVSVPLDQALANPTSVLGGQTRVTPIPQGGPFQVPLDPNKVR